MLRSRDISSLRSGERECLSGMRVLIASEEDIEEMRASRSSLHLDGSAVRRLIPERGRGGRLRGLFFWRGALSSLRESSTLRRDLLSKAMSCEL